MFKSILYGVAQKTLLIFIFISLCYIYSVWKYLYFFKDRISLDKFLTNKFNKLIEAYQRHYRQTKISGEIDHQTYQLIKQHYKDMLTL